LLGFFYVRAGYEPFAIGNGSVDEERRPKIRLRIFVEYRREKCAKGARYPVRGKT